MAALRGANKAIHSGLIGNRKKKKKEEVPMGVPNYQPNPHIIHTSYFENNHSLLTAYAIVYKNQ